MHLSLNDHRGIQLFLGCLFIALISPLLLFWYLAFVFLLVKLFFIVCIIDFITRSSLRKKMSSFVIPALLASIVSLIISYLFYN